MDVIREELHRQLVILDYAEEWTWFDADGNALSDKEVVAMIAEDKIEAFLERRYAEGSTGGMVASMMGSGRGNAMVELPDGEMPSNLKNGQAKHDMDDNNGEMIVGTPDVGMTQTSGSSVDSSKNSTYGEMVDAYRTDIETIEAGDKYGNNLVGLYNSLHYIGAEDTENPTWVKILCGAAEGDISMFNSLNLQIAMLNSGIGAEIEWQWNGGHLPSEVLGNFFSLYVDQMYVEYVDVAAAITKSAAEPQTANGTDTEPTGIDLTDWVSLGNGVRSPSLGPTQPLIAPQEAAKP